HGVWPREVEEVLATHPDIVEVGVTGVPSPRYGESVKAFVVLRQGSTVSADDVIAWSHDRLASYKVPREIEFRNVLPRSHIGKVLRRQLATDGSGARLSTIQVNGAGLAVEERGAGQETILFCHG